MYNLSVPIMSATVTPENREIYLKLCREAGVERIFLALDAVMEPVPQSYYDNVVYFKSHGIEVGVWTSTVGHGFELAHSEDTEKERFSQMVDIQGVRRHHAICPLDRNFVKCFSEYIATLASSGVDRVLLDDDYRMSQHGRELCCACELHMKRISELVGEDMTLEKIKPYILSGKKNKYRDAWVYAQQEGLVELAKAIRREVDKVAPNVAVCSCTTFAQYNVDGVDMIEVAKILAGKNKPLLRLTGAPYWATKRRKFPLVTVFEVARMFAAFAEGKGVELLGEGDPYPRPRYACPASYLELFDAVTRIDGGYDGILKYMFDYIAGPNFELGYLDHHNENKEYINKLSEMFGEGANAGVRIIVDPHTYRDSDLDLGCINDVSPRPLDATMFGNCSVPTVYRGHGVCTSAFGENARKLDLSLLGDGMILDAVSSVILTEKGVDVGLRSYGALYDKNIHDICTNDPEYKSFISEGDVRMLSCTLAESAQPLLYVSEPKEENTLAYRYENAKGERFLVFLFEGNSVYTHTGVCLSGLTNNYAVQEVLLRSIPWISRKKLPAYCEGHPELYVMCHKDENSTSVALFNCFADAITKLKIHLDKPYTHIECLGCEAEVDGDTVTLATKLHAFESAAFRVYCD